MSRIDIPSDIYNGAKCKSYRWSQSYSDLEIRIKLPHIVKYENVDVIIDVDRIKVTLNDLGMVKHRSSDNDNLNKRSKMSDILMKGKFKHPVDTESAYWLLENEELCIVIYIDKVEDLWWKELLINEEVTVHGPINYTVSMEHMDTSSRMAIDRLIVDQRNKMAQRANGQYLS